MADSTACNDVEEDNLPIDSDGTQAWVLMYKIQAEDCYAVDKSSIPLL